MNKYIRGLILFVVISLVALFFLFRNDFSGDTLSILNVHELKGTYFLVALSLLVIFVICEGIRLQILALGVEDKTSLKTGVIASLTNEFLSAITPFQSGGQPFEVFVLHRDGISLGKVVVISYFKTATSLIVLTSCAIIGFILYPELLGLSFLKYFYVYGILFVSYFITLTILSVFKPLFAKKLAFNGMKILRKIHIIKRDTFHSKMKYVLREVNLFNYHIKKYYFHKKLNLSLSVLMTFATWVVKFSMAYFILLGLGIDSSYLKVVFYQYVIQFVNYAMPTPGSSGTSEFTAYTIFKYLSMIFHQNEISLKLFVMLWRVFSYHIIILVSGLVSFSIIKDWLKSKQQEKQIK